MYLLWWEFGGIVNNTLSISATEMINNTQWRIRLVLLGKANYLLDIFLWALINKKYSIN